MPLDGIFRSTIRLLSMEFIFRAGALSSWLFMFFDTNIPTILTKICQEGLTMRFT